MSSLIVSKNSIFCSEHGIVTWEDFNSIPNQEYVTISVLTAQIATLHLIVSEVISFLSPSRFFRFRKTTIPNAVGPGIGIVQFRNMKKWFLKDAPGFGTSSLVIIGNEICAASELTNILELNLNHLSDYRGIIVLDIDSKSNTPDEISQFICKNSLAFDGKTINQLFSDTQTKTALRIIDRESYLIAQIMLYRENSLPIINFLTEFGVRQILDASEISKELLKIVE